MLNFNKFRPSILYQAQKDGSTGGVSSATLSNYKYRILKDQNGFKTYEKSLDGGLTWEKISEAEYQKSNWTGTEFTPIVDVGSDTDNIAKIGAATNNAVGLFNSTKGIISNFKNDWQALQEGEATGLDKAKAIANMAGKVTANATGMAGTTIANFIDKGAQNARDVQTEGMISTGLDVIGLIGPYGAALKGVGDLTMAFGNNYAAKVGNRFKVDETLKTDLGNAYNGMFDDLDKAANPGLKAIFHSGKVARQQARAKMNQMFALNIRDVALDVNDAAGYEGTGIRNAIALNGGYKALKAGKKGMKINNPLDWARYAIKAQNGIQLNRFKMVMPPNEEAPDFGTANVPNILQGSLDSKKDNPEKDEQPSGDKTGQKILDLFNLLIADGKLVHSEHNGTHMFTSNDEELLRAITSNPDMLKIIKEAYPLSNFVLDAPEENNPSNPYDNLDLLLNLEDLALYASAAMPQNKPIVLNEGQYVQNPLNLRLETLNSSIRVKDSNADIEALLSSFASTNLLFMQSMALEYLNTDLATVMTTLENAYDKDTNALEFINIVKGLATKYNKSPEETLNNLLFSYTSPEVASMKQGGTFNVIPDGALHKNKHNMEDAEGLTKKGIPVVTEEEGKLVQLAEIEKNEIIFRLEVTKKLEELAKKGTDEAAIEAGKLLVKEILHNTEDNTGLIDEVN